ncbi:crosslink repair DNA glycosylase YcaQ family protein [Chryseolinea sp. T2]|uniref:winged helix-turn-helix domain-containing protein n=1 Tax=Chryseolinea sp. T2 TaxID=3129255 RepID=UPI0030768CB9
MKPLVISNERARSIVLHAAGLSKPAQFGKGKEAVYKYIEHLGFLQIDTNYIVERAHHHSIWSRVPDYETEWLFELQDESRIYEFWTFASGFMPMENFRFSYPIKEALASRRHTVSQKEANLMNQILDRISREGPLMARNFENDRVTKSTGWWDWRPSKVALERLHSDGSLISTRRRDFQKLYDLSDNVIPSDIDKSRPTPEEFAHHIILSSLRAWGIGYIKDVAYRGRYVKNNVIRSELKKLVDEGVVCQVEIDRFRSAPLYMLPEYQKRKIALSGDIFILSPFDVLNVLRHRLKDFFAFDYQVECFVPEKKRKYGYFALPVLMGDTFIARMDAKADRKQDTLFINYLHFDTAELDQKVIKKLARSIREYVRFNDCLHVSLTRCNDKRLKQDLLDLLGDIVAPAGKRKGKSKR